MEGVEGVGGELEACEVQARECTWPKALGGPRKVTVLRRTLGENPRGDAALAGEDAKPARQACRLLNYSFATYPPLTSTHHSSYPPAYPRPGSPVLVYIS